MEAYDLKTEHIYFKPATKDDIDTVLEMENAKENRSFIRQWTKEKHLRAIEDDNTAHFVIRTISDKKTIGYVILLDVLDPDNNLQFKRIVIEVKGRGFGRDAVKLIKKFAFEYANTHRLWLEVVDFNERAYRLYESEGFKLEGTHRESMRQGDSYHDLHVQSMLKQEY